MALYKHEITLDEYNSIRYKLFQQHGVPFIEVTTDKFHEIKDEIRQTMLERTIM